MNGSSNHLIMYSVISPVLLAFFRITTHPLSAYKRISRSLKLISLLVYVFIDERFGNRVSQNIYNVLNDHDVSDMICITVHIYGMYKQFSFNVKKSDN